jgi:methionyl-tRNA formyltransferase
MLSDKLRLKVVFMGTPEFSVLVLAALCDAGHDVVGVYSQPDRPAGRGGRVAAPPVKSYAVEQGLSTFQPRSLRRDEGARQELASLAPDLIVVAAYGLILPADTLDVPRLGSLNIHPSLLPRHRGPSPVAAAILDGEPVTGVTVMKLDETMDTGPIVTQRPTPIGADETAEELTSRLFQTGATLLIEELPRWASGELQAVPQDGSLATVTSRLSRQDGEIDWSRPAELISRQVRAYYPWPGSFTHWKGARLKVIEALEADADSDLSASQGEVVLLDQGGLGVGTGSGVLQVRRVQLEGGAVTTSAQFVQGHREFVGSILGS